MVLLAPSCVCGSPAGFLSSGRSSLRISFSVVLLVTFSYLKFTLKCLYPVIFKEYFPLHVKFLTNIHLHHCSQGRNTFVKSGCCWIDGDDPAEFSCVHSHSPSGTRPLDVSHTSLGLICQSFSLCSWDGQLFCLSPSPDQSWCHRQLQEAKLADVEFRYHISSSTVTIYFLKFEFLHWQSLFVQLLRPCFPLRP